MHRLAWSLVATFFVVACSSVPNVTYTDNGASSSGGGTGSSSGNSGASSGIIDPNCKPTGPEICDDGLDNDCEGHIDCSDPACQPNWQCVDPPPADWTLVALADASRPGCPLGFGSPTDLKIVQGNGSGTCTCACAPTTGSCDANQFGVVVDTSACSTTPILVTPNNNCTALPSPFTIGPTGTVANAAAPAAPTACSGTTTRNAPPLTDGRICPAPQKSGKGCPGAQICVPKPVGFNVCIAKSGANACPVLYTQQRSAGSDASTDGRSCSTCNCTPTACAGTITLFEASDCSTAAGNGHATTGALGPTCGPVQGKNYMATHYKSTITANGCAQGAFDNQMQGSITFADEQTVCCK